jgi:hypothetical protein
MWMGFAKEDSYQFAPSSVRFWKGSAKPILGRFKLVDAWRYHISTTTFFAPLRLSRSSFRISLRIITGTASLKATIRKKKGGGGGGCFFQIDLVNGNDFNQRGTYFN